MATGSPSRSSSPAPAILGELGPRISSGAPPVPSRVVLPDGRTLLEGEQILHGHWAAVTFHPGEDVTYTQNWPHEPLVGNRPTGGAVVWSVVSFVLLLAGIGALAWYQGSRVKPEGELPHPARDPLLGLAPTPSQRATVKYFWTAAALFVVQIGLGAVTAHYGVEGSKLYGVPLAQVLPYAVTRTWHLQLGIFWIATSSSAGSSSVSPPAGRSSGAEGTWIRARPRSTRRRRRRLGARDP